MDKLTRSTDAGTTVNHVESGNLDNFLNFLMPMEINVDVGLRNDTLEPVIDLTQEETAVRPVNGFVDLTVHSQTNIGLVESCPWDLCGGSSQADLAVVGSTSQEQPNVIKSCARFPDVVRNVYQDASTHNFAKKHKLPFVDSSSSPKMSRYQALESGLTPFQMDHSPHIGYPTNSLLSTKVQSKGLCTPKSNLMFPIKNHTVTSADVEVQNQAIPADFTSQLVVGPEPQQEAVQNPNSIMPIQIDKNPNVENNSTPGVGNSRPSLVDSSKNEELQTPPLLSLDKFSSDQLISVKAKKPEMFAQLLDMFPDIDETFLSSYCEMGLDLMQVADLILELNNNYPLSIKNQLQHLNSTFIETNNSTRESVVKATPISAGHGILGNAEMLTSSTVNENTNAGSPLETINAEHFQSAVAVPSLPVVDREDSASDSQLPQSVSPSPSNAVTEDIEARSQLDFLLEIFPDAEPNFLKSKSDLTEDALKTFISHAMEKQDYPKIIVKEVKKEETNSINPELFTSSFDVESFLKIIPDPFSFFLNEKRVCHKDTDACEFLRKRYRYHSVSFIWKIYNRSKFNLARTCEILDTENPSRASRRSLSKKEIGLPGKKNLSFLQEVCFVEHKAEIKAHIDALAEAKSLAYKLAEENGELIECCCCYQEVVFEDCAACNEGDLFCKTCIQKSSEIRIGDGCTTFPCLLDCGSSFSLQLLQTLLEARVFSRLLNRIQLDEVKAADIEGLEVCPFCEFATIPPPETSIFTCLNPECLKESCRKCHKLSHIPQRCEEVENDDQARARKYIEDEMTRALVRECYRCKKSFIKLDGCNKMVCTCGAQMCYFCRQPITNYNHFKDAHVQNCNKCPLYSTEKLLHVDAVNAVAKQALEKVTASNPKLQLKHDPTKLLPSAAGVSTTLPNLVIERAILDAERQARYLLAIPGANVINRAPRQGNQLVVPRQRGGRARRFHVLPRANVNNGAPQGVMEGNELVRGVGPPLAGLNHHIPAFPGADVNNRAPQLMEGNELVRGVGQQPAGFNHHIPAFPGADVNNRAPQRVMEGNELVRGVGQQPAGFNHHIPAFPGADVNNRAPQQINNNEDSNAAAMNAVQALSQRMEELQQQILKMNQAFDRLQKQE